MKKMIVIAIVALSLISFLGCSKLQDVSGGTAAPAAPKILRKAQLGGGWEMRHVELDIAPGQQLPILLKLGLGDKVDGYFYLEQGSNVDFQITANSLVYKPSIGDPSSPRNISSDRFSFTATQAQGNSYTLTFRNTAAASDKQARVTVFLEPIYPSDGTVFTLLESK